MKRIIGVAPPVVADMNASLVKAYHAGAPAQGPGPFRRASGRCRHVPAQRFRPFHDAGARECRCRCLSAQTHISPAFHFPPPRPRKDGCCAFSEFEWHCLSGCSIPVSAAAGRPARLSISSWISHTQVQALFFSPGTVFFYFLLQRARACSNAACSSTMQAGLDA